MEAPFADHNLQIDVLLIHEALDKFAGLYPRQARVVELKFFGGQVRRILDAIGQGLPGESGETFAVRIVGIQNHGVRRACTCAFK